MKENNIYIYGLSSSNEPENIRYIGYTNNLYKRRCDHVTESRQLKTHRHKWVRSVINEGHKLLITELNCVPDEEKGQAEIDMIKLFRSFGAKLVNGNGGGVGGKSPSIETRQKLSLSKIGNTWNKGRKRSELNNRLILEAIKKPKTEKAKLNMSLARKGKKHSLRRTSDDFIIKTFELYNSGLPLTEMINLLNTNKSHISNILFTDSYLDVKKTFKLKVTRTRIKQINFPKRGKYKTKENESNKTENS